MNTFAVDGSRHSVVAGGDTASWDGARAAAELEKVVRESRRFWGALPFRRYLFLFVVREKGGGVGGLEHAHSALMFTSPAATCGKQPGPGFGWGLFVPSVERS